MFNHPVAEHLPQDIAAELRQHGIDELILLAGESIERAV